MSLSVRSRTFQDTYSDINEILRSGQQINKEELDKLFESKGVNPLDYKAALAEYKSELTRGEDDFTARTTFIGRTLGRAVGDAAAGVVDFADLILPETITDVISEAADNVNEFLPDEVQKTLGEVFDPYHGEGLLAGGEEIVGTLGSYIIPGTQIAKGVNFARAGLNFGRSASSRALLRKQLKNIDKSNRKKFIEQARTKKKRADFLKDASVQGASFAAGQTIVEDPVDNGINLIIGSFPDSEEYLQRLAVDPNDSTAKQYLQAYINNLGLTGIFGGPLALAAAYKTPLLAGLKTGASKIPGVNVIGDSKTLNALRRNFSSRLGTGDDELIGSLVKVSKGAEAGVLRAEGLAKDLSKIVKNEYGKNPEIVDKISKALAGQKGAMSSLKPETQKLVREMRSNVDDLSKEVMDITKGELQTTIGENLDVYLTKSYDFFDDPIATKKISKEFEKFMVRNIDTDNKFSKAIQSIMDTKGVDENDARAMLAQLIRGKTSAEQANAFSGIITAGRKITSAKAGMKKKGLPEGVSALLGEVKDPFKNYVKTMGNLSRIKAEKDFLEDVAKNLSRKEVLGKVAIGGPKGKFQYDLDSIGAERLSRVFGRTPVTKDQVANPLKKIYVDENYATAIREGLSSMEPTGDVMRGFMYAKGITQTMKTAFSPTTHGRNVMGNGILLIANGFGGPKGFGKAITSTAAKLGGVTNKNLADKYAEYLELGVASSGVNIGVIRKNLNAFSKNSDEAIRSIVDRENRVKSVAKFLPRKTLELYQAEDDLFKIAHFEKTLDYIKKSKKYKNLSLAEQKDIAAQRTRDLMPNYNLVPRFFKKLRTGILSDYLSFPAEMTRISKNLAKYSLQDIFSGDSVLKAQGSRRLAGFTSVGIAGDMLADFSADMMGLTNKQQEAFDATGPSWEYNTDRIYLSPITRDKNKHLGIDYLNLGPIDPFSYLKQAAKGTHTLIAAGFGDDEYSNAELEKIALGTLDNAVGPFLSPAMITEALMAVAGSEGRKDIFQATASGDVKKLFDAVYPLVEVATPGFLDFVVRRNEYEKSLAKYDPLGLDPRKKGGATFVEEEVDLPSFLGLKRQRRDLTAGTNFAVNPALSRIKNAGNEFDSLINRDFNLTDADDLFDRYKFAQQEKITGFQELRSILESYQDLYGDNFNQEFYRGLQGKPGAKKISEEDRGLFSAALQNFFIPFELNETNKTRLLTLPPITREPYDILFRNLYGKAIE